ncbi:GTP-binding protein [Mesobaculum littorinae]|nr:GTP-binding protein [Mesobaculum littorinae]
MIQGVQMLIEGEARRLRLLFIGRGFEGMGLGDGFAACNSA